MSYKFDVVVIGGGPGGYVAAIRAAQLKLKVAVVEKDYLGGICLNYGCIPTKALLHSAGVYHTIKHAEEFGIECSNIKVNLQRVVERSRLASERLANGIKHLLQKNNVTIFYGHGTIDSSKRVTVTTDQNKTYTLIADNIILATGAKAKVLPELKHDGHLIWSYKEAIVPEKLPDSILIVGSGAIGVEFASFYNILGSKVTIVEIADRILRAEDEEIAMFAHKSFENQGIEIMTGAKIQNVKKNSNSVEVEILYNNHLVRNKFSNIIVAAGIIANTENMGLESTKVQLQNGHVRVNQYMQTDEPGIYAIGDLVSPPWLAHKASHEGIICAEKIANLDVHPICRTRIPSCTYCMPQIASIGLTEQKAKEHGFDIRVGKFPFTANGKAIAIGATEGMMKTIFDAKTGELLGAHMVGMEVTEMIQGFSILKYVEGTELDIFNTVFPHPTISEVMLESSLSAYQRAIHI